MNRSVTCLALAAAMLLPAGCSGGRGASRTTAAPSPTAVSGIPIYLRVTTASGGPLLVVAVVGATTRITSRLGGAPVAITGTGGRYTEGRRMIALITSSPDGVKLKNTAGRTLWRARLSAGRVRIRRGEADTRYEFRREADGRIKVKRGETEVGAVRPLEQGATVETRDGVTVARSGTVPSDGLAVLLCREVPPDLRAVLVAALVARR